MTRADNAHAKAGNLNAAFARTVAPFILVLDADFVPQRRMLMRAIGFFDDPAIGIVQMPHYFFNDTPLQANLDMRTTLPDEQRFFFDVIQPGRDGWNCSFCCGSNGIIRRAALEAIGGAMPTESITEDMLLTLAMLRKGPRLAGDLAAELEASWPTMSRHLAVLKDADLITAERQGNQILYRVNTSVLEDAASALLGLIGRDEGDDELKEAAE